MRILLVSHFFPPQRVGGAEKIALMYAAALQRRGHQPQVVCAAEWEESDLGKHNYNGFVDETLQGIPVRRVNFNWTKAKNPNRSLYDNEVIAEHFSKWLEVWQPDVVHIISLITFSASIIEVIKEHNIPLVFTLVDFWLVCPKVNLVRWDETLCDGKVTENECLKCLLRDSNIYNSLLRVVPEATTLGIMRFASHQPMMTRIRGLRGKLLNIHERREVMSKVAEQVDCFIAPSIFLLKIIQDSGLLSGQAHLIHYGHELSWLKKMPDKKQGVEIRIGYIGQIIPLKGLHLLIKAFRAANAIAIRQGFQAKLLIYGDQQKEPDYTEFLMTLIGEDPNILIVGPYQHDQIGEVLAHLNVVVVPSQWHENNPLVVQEAFASRTPVIGSNVGGIAEFVKHGVNGLLFSYNSVDDLQAQIERVIFEPELIGTLEKGIKSVKTITEEVDEIINIYQGLLPQST